jgi:hypothetical protein
MGTSNAFETPLTSFSADNTLIQSSNNDLLVSSLDRMDIFHSMPNFQPNTIDIERESSTYRQDIDRSESDWHKHAHRVNHEYVLLITNLVRILTIVILAVLLYFLI